MYSKGLRVLSALIAMVVILSICMSAFAYDTIPFGSKGDSVRDLQRALKSKGYYKGVVDGTFGQKTRSAVYRYQRAIGLATDGKAGNKTLTALYDGISALNKIDGKKTATVVAKKSSTLVYGSTGDGVKNLQRMLKKAGYYKGKVDGDFGDLVLAAVKRFQWAKGLSGDGKVGSKTLSALKKSMKK